MSELEGLRWKRFGVLDQGSVTVADVMGDDQAIADAARISYGKGTRSVSDDRTLLRYLMRHNHATPFEMAELKLVIRAPMDVWRQLVRHRAGRLVDEQCMWDDPSINEYSTRYSEAIDAMQATAPDAWRTQAKDNKQGSGGFVTEWGGDPRLPDTLAEVFGEGVTPGSYLSVRENALHDLSTAIYKERLAFGVAREQARKDLPLSTYCYDAATEVLTDRGFVAWPDVNQGDRIGIWDRRASSLYYEFPEYLTRDYYCGPMYRVDHRGVDLLVTPHHKMYVSRGGSFELVAAEELGDRSLVRYTKCAGWLGPADWESAEFSVQDSRSLLSLYGFFIGDGCAPVSGDKNAIVFSLRRQRKIEYLKSLCSATGLEFDVRGPHFLVRAEGITDYFRALFYDEEGRKKIPAFMLKLNCLDSLAVLDGLRNSDGCTRKGGAWRFDTTAPQVAEAVVVLGIHGGCAVNTIKPTLREGESSDVYHVQFFADRSRRPVVNQMNRNTSWERYDGYVYCAKTRTGVMVVRRSGKVVLSGNTEAYWKCDLRNVLGFLALRMDGHAQQEIREYANVIGLAIVAPLFPQTWEAFLDYQLNAITLTDSEQSAVRILMRTVGQPWETRAVAFAHFENRRERSECEAKLERLGIIPGASQ